MAITFSYKIGNEDFWGQKEKVIMQKIKKKLDQRKQLRIGQSMLREFIDDQ